MVITPLYPFIMALFLLAYNNILILYIVNALVYTFIFYLLEFLIKEKTYLLFVFAFFPIPLVLLNYNSFLFLYLVLLLFLEESKYKYKDFLIGIIIAFSILTKQSVGIFFIIPSIIFYKKVDLKKRFVGFIIPCILFLIYLLISNSFYNFLNLCLFGLFDFTGNSNGINIVLLLFVIMLIVSILIVRKHPKDMIGYYVLSFYSIFIPLFDSYHFMFSFIGFLILVLYYYDFKYIKKKIVFYGSYLLLTISFVCMYHVHDKIMYPNNLNHFEFRYLTRDNIENVNKISEFVKNNKVIVYDARSYLYRIVNDQKIGYLDLVNHGNYGYNGSKKIIRDLKKHKDYLILLNLEEKKVIDAGRSHLDKDGFYYILKHGKKIGEIDQYTIYKLN